MLIDDAWLAAVRIDGADGIRPAAEALRDAVRDIAGLRVAVTHNIASASPMRDAAGAVLASEVFGDGGDQCWWTTPHLALTSPLPMACRFEGEPFWCNAHGIRTRSANPLLAGIDLSNFRRRALASAAIVAPVHLPFGEIGAASFLSPIRPSRIWATSSTPMARRWRCSPASSSPATSRSRNGARRPWAPSR